MTVAVFRRLCAGGEDREAWERRRYDEAPEAPRNRGMAYRARAVCVDG